MSETPRTDDYRVAFKRRKESSELIGWILDEFAQEERKSATLEHDLARRAEDVRAATRTLQMANDKIEQLERDLAAAQEWAENRTSIFSRDLAAAQTRIAVLEEAYKLWDQHSFVQFVAERRELRERVGHLEEMLGLAAAATNGWKILHEESQERVAKLEDLLNAYKNALRVHRQAEELVLMREKEWQGCQDPGYVVIDGGSLTLALEFSKDMTLANRDNLRADLQLAKERIAALTEALTGALTDEYLAGVEWGIKNVSVRADWPLSWEAGWPGMKAQALLDRAATREQAKETA